MGDILSVLSSDGTLSIWYIERLQKISADLPKRRVPLDSLSDLDQNLWFNTYGEIPTCRAVAMHAKRIFDADLQYPVILSPDGEVMDGMHRVAKAWILGSTDILVVQFDEMPPPDEVVSNFDTKNYRKLSSLA